MPKLILPPSLNPRRSLQARFALLLGGTGLIFALLAALLVDRYQRDQLVKSQGQAMRREAQLVSRTLDVALQDRLQQLSDAAALPLLTSGLMEPGDERLLLERLKSQQSALAWVALVDARGRVQVATNGLLQGQSVAAERWFTEAQRAPWIGTRRPAGELAEYLGLEGGGTPALMDIAVPVTDLQGRSLGVLVALLRWDWLDTLHRSLLSSDLAAGIESIVLDRDGRVLLGPLNWLGQAPALAPETASALALAPRVIAWGEQGEYLTAGGRFDTTARAAEAKALATPLTTPSASTAATVSASVTVLLRQPAALAFRDADVLRQRLLVIGLLGTLVYIGLSLWLALRVARPIRALSDAAARVGRGEAPQFDALPAKRSDEVADLARALQSLHLELSHRLLEQQRATARFESLFRDAPVAVYLTVNRRIQMANDACLQLFAAPHVDALRGMTSFDIFLPEDRHLLEGRIALLERWQPGDRALPILSHRIVRLDGRVAEVESTAMPTMMGNASGVQVVLRDVTEERRAQALLREREAQLAQTSRMAEVGGWSVDLVTGKTTWTDEMARIYEMPVGRVPTAKEAMACFDPPDREQLSQALSRLLNQREAYDLILKLHTQSGKQKWVRAQGRGVERDGQLVSIYGMTQDITERREAEDAVRELNAELETRVADRTAALQTANAELDSFAYAVSHDLRAPLRAMSGFSQALIEDYGDQLDEGAKVYIEQINKGSQRMGGLIDGLLALSRSVRGEMRRDEVDLSALAARVLSDLRRAEPYRQVEARIEPGLRAQGDRRMLDAVITNLVGNAWKYSARVEVARIDFHSLEQGGVCWFCLTDNGAGFDMAHAGRLFKAFARLHRQDEFAGIGIGLATVQRVIHRHGGRIEARSVPGQGATFRFTLPA